MPFLIQFLENIDAPSYERLVFDNDKNYDNVEGIVDDQAIDKRI